MPVHIRDKAKSLIYVLRKKGFADIRMHATVEGKDDPEVGEQTMEEKALHDERYVSMIIEAEFPCEGGGRYDRGFDEEMFWEDFIQYLTGVFGGDVEVIHHEHCHEFEIIRR